MAKISHLQTEVQLICLVGPGGCGKETKGKILWNILSSHLCTARFVMSELIEDLKKRHDRPETITATQQQGGLVNDGTVIPKFAQSVIDAHEQGASIIMADGFPRSVKQAHWLLNCRVPFHLIHIEIDEDESVRRISERSQKQQRIDDASVRNRYYTYTRETLPAIKQIKKTNPHIVTTINGTLTVREQMVRMLRPIHALARFKAIPLQDSIRMADDPHHTVGREIRKIDGYTKPVKAPAEMVAPHRCGDLRGVSLFEKKPDFTLVSEN